MNLYLIPAFAIGAVAGFWFRDYLARDELKTASVWERVAKLQRDTLRSLWRANERMKQKHRAQWREMQRLRGEAKKPQVYGGRK